MPGKVAEIGNFSDWVGLFNDWRKKVDESRSHGENNERFSALLGVPCVLCGKE